MYWFTNIWSKDILFYAMLSFAKTSYISRWKGTKQAVKGALQKKDLSEIWEKLIFICNEIKIGT